VTGMKWKRKTGPIRPLWTAWGRANYWVIVEAGHLTPFLLYSHPRRESLKRERAWGEYRTLVEAKAAAEEMESAAS